ncbi:MAG: hypothetical protein O6949_03035 [Chloroflexi bacterium]|nr:hypothetical protein [Chloroflexota bacterium]
MIPLSTIDMQMIIGATIFILGCMCVLLGIFVLVSRGYSREIRALATHSARLGRKGMAEEVTGLVNSASELVGALNSLVKTASGAGLFLIILGIGMIAASYWVVEQIQVI